MTKISTIKGVLGGLFNPKTLLLFLVFILPLALVSTQSQFLEFGKAVYLYSFLILILLILVARIFFRKKLNLAVHPIDAGFLALLVVLSIGSLLGVSVFHSFIGFNLTVTMSVVTIAALTISYFLSKQYITAAASAKYLFAAVAFSGAIVVLVTLAGNFIAQLSLPIFSRSINQFGFFVGIAAIASLLLVQISVKRIWKILALLNLILLSLVVIWLDSLPGILSIIVFLFLFILLSSSDAAAHAGKRASFLTGYMLLMTIAIFLPIRAWLHQAPTIDLSLPLKYSAEIAIEEIKHEALFGTGLQNFSTAFYAYKPLSYNLTNAWDIGFSRSGSLFFELLATAGILGTLAFYLPFAGLVYLGQKNVRKNFKDPSGSKEAVIDVALVALLCTLILLSFIVAFELSLLAIMFVLGGCISGRMLTNKIIKREFNNGVAQIASYAGLLLLVIPNYYLGRVVAGDLLLSGLSAENAQAQERSISRLNTAIELIPWQAENYLTRAQVRMAGAKDSSADLSFQAEQVRADLTAAQQLAGERYEAYVALRSAELIYAKTFNQAAIDTSALQQKMKSLDPRNPELYYLEGSDDLTLIEGGQVDKVSDPAKPEVREKILQQLRAAIEQNFNKALELKPDYAAAYSRFGDYYRSTGDLEKAENMYLKALIIEPLNKDYLLQAIAILRDEKKTDEAKQLLTRYLKDNPEDKELLDLQKELEK